jgi:Lon protease-like protein
MSDALDKVSGLTRLPIFPLPLVMLPNELIPLHIFEDRYRKMLVDIELSRKVFGITLFEKNESFIEKPPVGTVGTVAEVRESEMLSDGRSNILTLGLVRYRLTSYEEGEPYFVGNVDFFEDDKEDAKILDPLADEVFATFERMAKAAFRLGGSRGEFPSIQRADPESLSFLITAAFNFENEKKQSLLEMTSTTERLLDLKQILDQTVVQMEESAEINSVAKTNGHSKKNIDL